MYRSTACRTAAPKNAARCTRRDVVLCQYQSTDPQIMVLESRSATDGLARRGVLLAGIGISLAMLTDLSTGSAQAANITTVFVAGASGATGRRVVRELRKRGLKVRAGVRDVEKARSNGLQLDDKVELVTADVTQGPESLLSAIGDAQAIISAIGFNGGADSKGYEAIDNKGNCNLVDAAKQKGISRFVLMSSLLTNGAAVGQRFNPGYIILNLFGNVLVQKLESEKYLRSSGLDWTIVRPGGLSNKPPAEVGNLIVGKEDTLFGRPSDPGKDISRDLVAAVLVEAMLQSSASNKVVETVSSESAPQLPPDQWFSSL
ncbi:Protein TIC 62, chloroplastic [Coccomyxa sp. Obi]|nr:Protein TIC 62, chloroplastic [Coccomyxa sp. Obi]